MRRGDLVTVALSGDFGKPRPALVIQSNEFDQTGTIAVLLISGTLVDAPPIAHYGATNSGKWFAQGLTGDGRQGHVCEARQA